MKRSKGIPSVVDDMACIWKSLEALNNNSNLGKSRSTLACNPKTPRKKVKGSLLIFHKTQQLTDVSNVHSGFALVSVELNRKFCDVEPRNGISFLCVYRWLTLFQ